MGSLRRRPAGRPAGARAMAVARPTESASITQPHAYVNSIALSPDSPDGLAFSQPQAPISSSMSRFYARSGARVLTDATGERGRPRFRQHFRGLRMCRPDPNGESGGLSGFSCAGHDEGTEGTLA